MLNLILWVATTSLLPFLILTVILPPIVKWMSFFLQRERNIKDLQTILFAFSHKLLVCVTTNLSFLKECLSIWSAAMVPWDYSLNDGFGGFNLLSAEHSSLSARVVIWHQCHLQLWQSLLCFCSSNYINLLVLPMY